MKIQSKTEDRRIRTKYFIKKKKQKKIFMSALKNQPKDFYLRPC